MIPGKLTEELQPCPFCGGRALVGDCAGVVSVSCQDDLCGCEIVADTIEESIAKWNRRAELGTKGAGV